MGGFEQHLIGSGSPVRLDTSVLLNDSTKMSTQSPDSVSGTNKANALDGKPTSNQPDTASLDRKVHESNSHMEVIVAQASQSEAAAKVTQMMGGPHDVPVVNSPSIDVNDTHINIPRAHDIFTTQTETEDSVVVSHPVDQTLELQVLNLLSGQQGFNATDGAHSAAILDQNVTTSTPSPTIPPRRNAELQNFGKNFLSGLKSSLRSKS
ncbi:uncharacterized protein LOC127831794 [Dreissena polymorpha]|uniref:Uncharacterized protein n=1 Tax=Dreissena polymorpha TaxID=45954 RepID=A0A9D4GUR8_DREPO|nr:uncharacterized protein LOC127831794 [Dreissena polymorpha]KAH3824071.1 hypothetical protein DPMN_125899 [Dreissena polymorpha]